MFSTQNFLSFLAHNRCNRVLYYASSGSNCGFVCDFDADIFIFSDYTPCSIEGRQNFWRNFHKSAPGKISLIAATPISRVFGIGKDKWGIFFFLDNNKAVEMIRKSGLRISTFVGVCCGCSEGGNYECVNRMPFFSKILDLMPIGRYMTVITDHSPFLPLYDLSEVTGDHNGKYNIFFLGKNNAFKCERLPGDVPGFPYARRFSVWRALGLRTRVNGNWKVRPLDWKVRRIFGEFR